MIKHYTENNKHILCEFNMIHSDADPDESNSDTLWLYVWTILLADDDYKSFPKNPSDERWREINYTRLVWCPEWKGLDKKISQCPISL